MTLENAAYAINGAKIGAALARRALYAGARNGGIVQIDDLKVSPLDVNGVGIQISEGVGLVLNGYQDDPNEVYVISNPGGHTLTPSEMPAANPAARSFMVAVVVGDPDFSAAGHPWMPSDGIPVEDREDFQYVRFTLIPVAAGETTLDVPYPALPLARLDIPANTSTINASMIKDVRTLAQPRQSQEIFTSSAAQFTNASPQYVPSGTAYGNWGNYAPSVKVPSWAKRAILVGHINGAILSDTTSNVAGSVRAKLGTVVGPVTSFDYPVGTGGIRDNLMAAGEYDVSSIAGTTVVIRVEGFESLPASPATAKRLRLQAGSQIVLDVRFFEQ